MAKPKSNEEVLETIRRCAKKLKRTPTLRELKALGIGRGLIERRWKKLSNALKEAGVPAAGMGFHYPNATLLLDWAGVTRKLGRIPKVAEYEKDGRFCHMPFHTRFRWSRVPDAFWRFAHESGVAQQWLDVLTMVEARPRIGTHQIHRCRGAAYVAADAGPGDVRLELQGMQRQAHRVAADGCEQGLADQRPNCAT